MLQKTRLVPVLLLIAAACAPQPAPRLTPEEMATWEIASHVVLTFNAENTRGCKLLGPIEYGGKTLQGGRDYVPFPPPSINAPSNFYDKFLVYRTALLGGNVALSAPNHGEPPELQGYRDELERAKSIYATQVAADRIANTRWIVGEAYRCETTK